jgi:hypothetical protein
MITYWCRFFDKRGSVFAAERLCAQDDRAAFEAAQELLAKPAGGFEIQDGRRAVGGAR